MRILSSVNLRVTFDFCGNTVEDKISKEVRGMSYLTEEQLKRLLLVKNVIIGKQRDDYDLIWREAYDKESESIKGQRNPAIAEDMPNDEVSSQE